MYDNINAQENPRLLMAAMNDSPAEEKGKDNIKARGRPAEGADDGSTSGPLRNSSHDQSDVVVPEKKKPIKRHFLLGTPTLPPWAYPLLDAVFIVGYSSIVYFLLKSGTTTRLVHTIWCAVHIPLAMVTNYYSRFVAYLFPNYPMVPLPIMYIYDTTWAVFIILSPFFLEYNNHNWDLIVHMIGLASLGSLVFLDPKPYEQEKQ
jgi:hypothetical protein